MRAVIAIGILACVLVLGNYAASQETMVSPSLEKLVGTYEYIGDKAKDQATIQTQIKGATAKTKWPVTKIAHERLEAANPIPMRLSISANGKVITIAMDKDVVVAPKDGSAQEAKNLAGRTVKASFHVKKASLIQDMDQSKGRRENTFFFTDAGNLVMQIKESSSMLSAPVEYSLLYKRTSKSK